MNFDAIISRALVVGIALLVGLPIILGVIGYLWNSKLRPSRAAKGKPTARFSNIWKRFIRFSFKEETATLAKKATNPFVKKIASLNAIYIASLILATVGFILSGSAWVFVPFVVLFLVAFGRANKVFTERYSLLRRMFEVANTAFHYDRGSEFDPWSFVDIQEWGKLTEPQKIVMKFPTKFHAHEQGAKDQFERHFTGVITEENIWVYKWDAPKGTVTATPVAHLPTMAKYPGVGNNPWNVFIVGEGPDGPISYDIMQTPHVLMAGSTGSGKSVLQRNVVFHCIQHNDRMRFLGVDLKRVELSVFNKYKRTVIGIGTDLEQGLGVVKYAFDQMNDRYKMMEELGVNNFIDLADPPYAIMLMIDEAFMFLGLSGSKTDEGKAADEMTAQASDLIGKILRLGRASGVFVFMATQRPDATVIKGEMKNNMDVRIAAGRMDSTPSAMVLDSGAATLLPGNIKGRGAIRFGGEVQQFQGYFAPQSWIDDWLLDHPDVEPSTIEEGGHLHERYLGYLKEKEEALAAESSPAGAANSDSGAEPKKKLKMSKDSSPKQEKEPKDSAKKISLKERLSFKASAFEGEEDEEETPVRSSKLSTAKEPVVEPARVETTPEELPAPSTPAPPVSRTPELPVFGTAPVEEEDEVEIDASDFGFDDDVNFLDEEDEVEIELLPPLPVATPEPAVQKTVQPSANQTLPVAPPTRPQPASPQQKDPLMSLFDEDPVENNVSENNNSIPVQESVAKPIAIPVPVPATQLPPPPVRPGSRPIVVSKPEGATPVKPVSPFAPKHQPTQKEALDKLFEL